MDKSIIGTLEERRCMALADYYLGKVAPALDEGQPDNQKLKLTSLDDLYKYLLLDTQMGQEMESSRLAEAIACLQLYIGAIYGGLEPGHTGDFSKDELTAWHQRFSNISDFAGYQMLLDYPENWINPTLRLNKSDSFKDLENNLGQASLSDESVQMALFEHLKKFEEVCNLDLISAYIDSIDGTGTGTGKGQSFKNADYYFIGRQRVQPFGYFWRKAHVELNAQSTFLDPSAWTEWKPIGIPASNTVLAMRPVWFAGRLMVVQVEGVQAPDVTEKNENGEETTIPGTWAVEVKLSYLAVNGIWSVPILLGAKQFPSQHPDTMAENARLVAVTYQGARKDVDDRLGVCFTIADLPPTQAEAASADDNGWIYAARDALFERIDPNPGSLQTLVYTRFANPLGLQHKLLGSEFVTVTKERVGPTAIAAIDQTREGLLSKFLSSNINFSSRESSLDGARVTNNVLQVQGVCDLTRPEYDLTEISLVSKEWVNSLSTYFEISKVGIKGIKLTCFHQSVQGFAFSLCFDGPNGKPVSIATFTANDFTAGTGWSTTKKNVVLSNQQLELLWMCREADIRVGARFSILFNDNYLSLTGSSNKLALQRKPETVALALKVMDGTTVVSTPWQQTVDLKGWFQTPWVEYRWTGNPVGKKLSMVWGEDADGRYGRDRYDITVQQVPNVSSVPLLSKQQSGAQFLDTRPLGISGVQWIRLNSLFGPELVARAAISIDEVLSRSTQDTLEPPPSGTAKTPIDFNSAHGAFYWELFFHLPFLIAHRLCEERSYQASQRWYQYIFNPHLRSGAGAASDRYWLCRPLLEVGLPGFEAKGLVDPDAIAFANRIHYRKTIFVSYVRCIIAHADSLYRRLTRDSLAAAKLQYVRALSLMGNAPTAKAMNYWVPRSATEIIETPAQASTSLLISFSRSQEVDVANLPARVEGTPDFDILALDVFRPPVNDQLLGIWKYIEECLWNMRHNLTIDGKPMTLALYAPPTNPLDLLHAQAGGSSGSSRNAGGWLNIPHYRFRPMLASAQNAVQTLIGFGREVRQLMEMRDRGQLEELQQSHVIALGAHAKTIQEETIKQLEASGEALKSSKLTIEERVKHYADLNGKWLLAPEIVGDVAALTGKLLGAAAIIPRAAGSVTTATIKEQTLAGPVGPFPAALIGTEGGDRGAPIKEVGAALTISGAVAYGLGEAAQRSAYYLRRSEEWSFAEAQANSELAVIEEQLKAQDHTLKAARASLAQTQKANEQAQEIYSFYKTRATNVELYRWLLSQMATLYFQCYDAVVGLCLSAEASWQYEMGDFDARVIRPNVWMDNRHGLSAGESMQLDLLRLERDFLNRNERRLELTKTISLRQLFEKGQFVSLKTWEQVLVELRKGKLDFEFSQELFDSDYPGHYCRQITSVELSLPVVLGPYQDVRATLMQTGSLTVLKANVNSLDYLYGERDRMPPLDILLNLRSHQQVGVSTGINDAGLHQLMFGDERYLPFEGTGAVSTWQLLIPRPDSAEQTELLGSLTDVIVTLRYLAKAGGTAYTDAVLGKLND